MLEGLVSLDSHKGGLKPVKSMRDHVCLFVCFLFFFSIFIVLLLEAGGWREVAEATTSPLLHSQLYNPDIHA